MFGVHFCSYLSITLNFALCPSPVFFRCCPTKSYILKTKVTSRNAAFVCVAFQCFRRNLRSHPARPRHRPGTCSLMSTPTQPPSWVCCATSPSCSWWSAMVGSSLLPVLNMQTVAVSPTISRTKLLPARVKDTVHYGLCNSRSQSLSASEHIYERVIKTNRVCVALIWLFLVIAFFGSKVTN